MKVGLVLGGGGVTGIAWLLGALEALEFQTGWDARSADQIVGTSAGALIGSLLASGVDRAQMNADAVTGDADASPAPDSLQERLGRIDLRPGALPLLTMGSWRLAMSTLAHPSRHPPPVVLAGWMPRGVMSTGPLEDLVRTFAGESWPVGAGFQAVAADYRTGRRVAFGREDAPAAALPAAVAASCAVPGVYRPVRISGRHYVDGGICSTSNLDLLRHTDVDLAICLNPMSSTGARVGGSAGRRLGTMMRAQSGRRLGHEARKLREAGKQVVLLQPGTHEADTMGTNLLTGRDRVAIAGQAHRSVTAVLMRLRAEGVALPG